MKMRLLSQVFAVAVLGGVAMTTLTASAEPGTENSSENGVENGAEALPESPLPLGSLQQALYLDDAQIEQLALLLTMAQADCDATFTGEEHRECVLVQQEDLDARIEAILDEAQFRQLTLLREQREQRRLERLRRQGLSTPGPLEW